MAGTVQVAPAPAGQILAEARRQIQKRGVPAERIYLSMERNMKCGIGLCGHCQYGPTFVCREGPVFGYPRIKDLMAKWEI